MAASEGVDFKCVACLSVATQSGSQAGGKEYGVTKASEAKR